MSIWMILKVFSDACVIFGILGAFPTTFTYSYSLLIPALLCGVGVGIAASLQDAGRVRLRWLGAILPLSCLYFAPSGEMLILLPVIGYTALTMLRGRFRLEYYSYRQSFQYSLMLVCALYVVLSMLAYIEEISGDARTIEAEVTLRYGIVYLITGVVLLRQLRLGLTRQSQGNRGQLGAMVGGIGAVILGFLAVEPALRKGASAVLNGLLSVVAGAVMVVNNLITSLIDQIEVQTMNEQIQAAKQDNGIPAMGPVFQEMMQQVTEGNTEEPSAWWIFLVMIILVAAMVLMLRSFRKRGGEAFSEEIVEAVKVPQQTVKEPRRSNRGKVRHYYREFLRMEKKRGLKLRKDLTTEDILQRISGDTDADAASELRGIYIRARYNRNCDITPEQVDAAKRALKRSRGGAT